MATKSSLLLERGQSEEKGVGGGGRGRVGGGGGGGGGGGRGGWKEGVRGSEMSGKSSVRGSFDSRIISFDGKPSSLEPCIEQEIIPLKTFYTKV